MPRRALTALLLLSFPPQAAAKSIPCTEPAYAQVVGACSPVHLARKAPEFTEVCMAPVGALLGSCHGEYQNLLSELYAMSDSAGIERVSRRLAALRKKFDRLMPIYVGAHSGSKTNEHNSLPVYYWSHAGVRRTLEEARKRVAAPANSAQKSAPPLAEKGGAATGGLSSPPPAEPDPEAVKIAAAFERVATDGGMTDPKALAIAGGAYANLGAPGEAVRVLNTALAAAGDDASIWTLRAEAKSALGDWKGAEADARRALELDPTNADARRVAAFLRNRAARAPKTRLDASGLAASDGGESPAPGRASGMGPSPAAPGRPGVRLAPPPSAAAPLILQAESKFAVGDRSAALLDASRAISLAPADARAWTIRARILNALGRHEAALKDATEALRLSPDDPAALLESAYARYGLGDYAAALTEVERALALSPGLALGHLYRAMILEKLGRTAEAVGEYREAARLDASLSPLVEEALARLAPGPAAPAAPPDRKRWWLAAIAGALLAFGLKRLARPGWVTTPQDAPSTAAPGTLGPGDRLDGYRIDGVAGEGGMGIVYEATDLALGRKVAIKRMSRDGRACGELRERFLREARLAAKLSHPNLALIHAVLDKGDPLLVFEYVDGRTLADVLAERGRLGLAEALPIVRGVGEALSHAHAHGVIHRDLKPANVMLPKSGGVKVLDLGIAHQSRTASAATMTAAWGTPPYMAPEQEDGVVSRATDVYALAVVCREMLTGRRPFDGPGMSAAKRESRLEPVSTFAADLPPGLDDLFRRGLAPDPSKRHGTIGEFVAALEAAARG